MQINDYRRMKNINRLNREPISREYNLLEHSYMVAILFMHFAAKEDVAYDMQVLKLIMHHDILETLTGDLPYPVKHLSKKTEKYWTKIEQEVLEQNPRFFNYSDEHIEKSMTDRQYQLFKACDLLDLWIFVMEEIAMGNTSYELHKVKGKCESIIYGNGQYPQFRQIWEYMLHYNFE